MADFEEDGAANLATGKEFHDDYISENQSIDAGHLKDFTDHNNQIDPLSYSGMAQNDPKVQHHFQGDEMEGHGDAIAGGYYYSDRADDLPANFARAHQPQVYGDEASEEYQGGEDEVRGHHADVPNPFMDIGEQDNGVSSGGYVDDRPIMGGGYNPFLDQEERCRADGDEVKEDLYGQGKDHYQQEDADHSYGDHEHEHGPYQEGHDEEIDDQYHKGHEEQEIDQYHKGHEEQEIDQYHKGDEEHEDNQYHKGDEEQEIDQYHRGHEEQEIDQYHKGHEEREIDQYHTGHVEQEVHQYHSQEDDQYHRGDEEEPADDQYQTGHVEQAVHEYHRGHEEEQTGDHYHGGHEEEQTADHYHGGHKEQVDGHYTGVDDEAACEQDYASEEHDYREDSQHEKAGKQEDGDYEEEMEKEADSNYKQLQEDQDDADLEMDPVENVRDVDEYGSKVKYEAVGCKLYGDGPAQEEKQDDDSCPHEENLIEEDNFVESETPVAIKCALFGEEKPDEGGHATYEEEMLPGEHVASDDVDEEKKQHVYGEGEKVHEDEQYDDEQEEKEDDERELDSVGQPKQADEDLGIVNQAFSDDVDVEDKNIEEEAHQEVESSEEFGGSAKDDDDTGTEAVDEDSILISKTVHALEECIPRNVELDDANKMSDVEDEINKDDYSKENYSDEDNVAKEDKVATCPKRFTSEFENTDTFSCHQDRNFADNLLELTSPDTVPQPLPSPPEPKDMSPFDTNAPSDSPSPCHENLGQHGDTSVDENNTGDYLAGEVEGETKFGVDGTAITSTNTRNGTFIHSEDEEEETEEESQLLDPGCVTATGTTETTETETSVDDRSGEYVGQAMETNDNALMSMSMEGSFYDDGGELIGGEDRRGQENHIYNEMDNYEQQSIELSQQIQNCFSQPSQNAFGLQDDYSQSAVASSAVNGGVDSLLDAPVTAPGLQTPVTEHDSALDSSVDVAETQEEFQTNDYGSHTVEDSEEPETIGESSIDAVGISSPPEEQTIDQKYLEEALGSIQVSEPAPEKAEEPSSSVDEIPPGPKSDDALAAAAAPAAAVAGVAAAAAAAAVSTTKSTTVKKSTTAKAGVKTSTTTTTKAVKEIKTTNGKPASAKKTEITTTTITKTTSKKPTEPRPTSAVTTDKKPTAKPTSPTKTASPAAPKPSGTLPSYAQPIAHRKPREVKPASPEEKKAHTPRTPSATARTPKPQSATTTSTSAMNTTITKTTARTTSAAASTTVTNRTAQLARPKSSPTKLTNGTSGPHSTTDNNKSPTKKPETKPASGTVKTVTEKKEIKVTSRIDSGTKNSTTTPKSPTKPSTPRTPSATTPKTGEVKEVKSKIGSLEKASHTPGGGNVKITTKKTDFTNVTSKIGSKDKMDHKPGGGNIKIENKKLKIEAKSKVGSLDNAAHKPAGGDKKIESRKLEFKEKASPKIGSLDSKKEADVPATNGVQSEN